MGRHPCSRRGPFLGKGFRGKEGLEAGGALGHEEGAGARAALARMRTHRHGGYGHKDASCRTRARTPELPVWMARKGNHSKVDILLVKSAWFIPMAPAYTDLP